MSSFLVLHHRLIIRAETKKKPPRLNSSSLTGFHPKIPNSEQEAPKAAIGYNTNPEDPSASWGLLTYALHRESNSVVQLGKEVKSASFV
jgi:hypothetical protein